MDASLAHEFGLEASDSVSEEELLHALASQLDIFLSKDPMRLLQILYRMDVDERAAEAAMDDANAAESLARLILQRTHLKAATRAAFRPPATRADDEDLLL